MSRRVLLLRTFVLAIAIIFLLCALTPMVVSTPWGNRQARDLANRFIQGTVEFHSMEISWMGTQKIDGLILKCPRGNTVFNVEHLTTETPLWDLLFRRSQLGRTSYRGVTANMFLNEHGWENFKMALGRDHHPAHGGVLVSFKDMEGSFNIHCGDQFSILSKGEIHRDDQHGTFEAEIHLKNLSFNHRKHFAHSLIKGLEDETSQIQVRLTDIPMEAVDGLLSVKKPDLSGAVESLFGSKLDLVIDKKQESEGKFSILLITPSLAFDFRGQIADQQLTLQEPAELNWDLQPEDFNRYPHHRIKLLDPLKIHAGIEELLLPLAFIEENKPLNLYETGFKGGLSVSPTNIEIKRTGILNVFHVTCHLDAPANDSEYLGKVIARLEWNKHVIPINYVMRRKKPTDIDNLLAPCYKFINKI